MRHYRAVEAMDEKGNIPRLLVDGSTVWQWIFFTGLCLHIL